MAMFLGSGRLGCTPMVLLFGFRLLRGDN